MSKVAHFYPEPVPPFTWQHPACQRKANCPGILTCSHCTGNQPSKPASRQPAVTPAVPSNPLDPNVKLQRINYSDPKSRPPGADWTWCINHASWGRHTEAQCTKRVSFPQELKVRTVKLSSESDHLFLPKVSSRNPVPRVPYSWAPKDNDPGVEISGPENPQILMAAIPCDDNLDNFYAMETDLAPDYNVNDVMDYSDSNLSMCMATMTPFSDSIVLPVTINGHEVLALVDTGATHNFITPTVALKLGLVTTSPEGNSKDIQVASTQLIPRIGSCQLVKVTLAPISESSKRRSIVTNFELLVLAQDAPSIILGLPSLALLGIGALRMKVSRSTKLKALEKSTCNIHSSSFKCSIVEAIE
jgi:hypothetical protein